MLSVMNSKLRWLAKTNKTTFSKKVNPMKYPIQIILLVYPIRPCNLETKCKRTSNLIKGISSHNICFWIKSQQVKKNICHSVRKTFDFSQNSFVLFHRVTFDHSISCVLLIDKPNGSCQNFKKTGKKFISTTKKAFKKKWNSITPGKTNAPISQTSSEHLKLTIQTYRKRNKKLKMKLQEEISKAS